MSPTLSTVCREDLVIGSAFLAQFDSGFIDFYTATRPAGPATAITTQTLLGSCPLAATDPAVGGSDGVITFGAITSDSSADASGTVTWARITKSDHTTAIMDVSVGTSGTDIIIDNAVIVAGGVIAVSSLTITMPAS